MSDASEVVRRIRTATLIADMTKMLHELRTRLSMPEQNTQSVIAKIGDLEAQMKLVAICPPEQDVIALATRIEESLRGGGDIREAIMDVLLPSRARPDRAVAPRSSPPEESAALQAMRSGIVQDASLLGKMTAGFVLLPVKGGKRKKGEEAQRILFPIVYMHGKDGETLSGLCLCVNILVSEKGTGQIASMFLGATKQSTLYAKASQDSKKFGELLAHSTETIGDDVLAVPWLDVFEALDYPLPKEPDRAAVAKRELLCRTTTERGALDKTRTVGALLAGCK